MRTPLLKTLSLVFVLLFTLTLSACSPVYNSTYAFQQPKSASGKQCTNTCLQNRSTCKMQCHTQNEQCRNNARQAALPAYVLYVANKDKERTEDAQHSRTKTIDDFAYYGNCSSDCDCESTYNQCFSSCGGVITEHRQCVAFCDKVPPNQLVQTQTVYQ